MDCILLHILSLAFTHLPLFVPKKPDVFVGENLIWMTGTALLFHPEDPSRDPFPASKGSVFSPA